MSQNTRGIIAVQILTGLAQFRTIPPGYGSD
jgi:hypothetical protein